ncbi:hypothetical protein [Oharaeibacter diazotrophicus]|uniref:Uncharacterized protein n=1 Tax=Oharaeibacter diazotrophicus TaxID=1920512 RepID=A0A4R6RD38_9HYPH|nr:hypothetical protein [Oharaeibacter diazotrophicus]TDP83955.1 hypothetical protein EDD54_2556 [Oharaeibacter diazotrophicus]BBE72995.1 hypothetical protein OHA_1_02600 [Pleomorphomonas sp. SM30]GLS74784.1 hypothetical protein GCM10007904_01190 [Oharaeibacter diazotrophicus]
MHPTNPWRRLAVRVSRSALFDMVFAAIDAVVAPPEFLDDSLARFTVWDRARKRKRVVDSPLPPSLIFSRTGLETTGILVGSAVEGADHVAISVDRMYPVLAQRTDDSVAHSGRSPELLSDLTWAFAVPWAIVGGFHSHALANSSIANIEGHGLFRPSPGDLHGGPIFIGNRVGLIATVTRVGAQSPIPAVRPCAWTQFRVADFEIWICAYSGANAVLNLDVDVPVNFRDPAENPNSFDALFARND